MAYVFLLFGIVFFFVTILQKKITIRAARVFSVLLLLLSVHNLSVTQSLNEELDSLRDYYDRVSPVVDSLSSLFDDDDYDYTPSYVSKPQDTTASNIPSGAYPPSQYKVGSDIPAGTYIVLPSKGDSGYFSVSSDPNGDKIIFNDYFSGNSIIEIRSGEYLELSSAYAVPYTPTYDLPNISVDSSFLVVGVHIVPGEYKLKATSDRGYYCIYSDLRHDDIVANDNFENTSYITLSEGQYLQLSHAEIVG